MVGNIHSAARRVMSDDGIRLKRALTSTGTDKETGKQAIWFQIIEREPEIIEREREGKTGKRTRKQRQAPKTTRRKPTARKTTKTASSEP
jgi:hypothetical protein